MVYILILLAFVLIAAAPLAYPGPLQTHAGFGPLYELMGHRVSTALASVGTDALPLTVARIATTAGATPLDAWKLSLVLAFALGAAGAFLLGRAWRGHAVGLVTAALYTFLPYRLMTAYVRGDAGESLFWGILPWLVFAPLAWRKNRTRSIDAAVVAAFAVPLLWRACVSYAPDYERVTAYAFQLFSAQWGYGNHGDWLDAVPLQLGLAPVGLSIAALALRRTRGAVVLAAIAAACALLSIAPFSAWWPWWVFVNTPWQLIGAAGLCLSLVGGSVLARADGDLDVPLLAATLGLAVLASYPYLSARGIDYTPVAVPYVTFGPSSLVDRVDLVDGQLKGPMQPGTTLTVTLLWQPRTPFTTDYQVFVHVVDTQGRLWAQRDRPPMDGTRPTTTWQMGELLRDPYVLTIPPDAPPNLLVQAGLYRLDTGMRLRTRTGGDFVYVSMSRLLGQ
ncbi:MAG: hypothetical protein HZB53_16715 [Chloroflexi bacterium]|nr:hypothetical protein [Chloroflexota bacterium]